MGGYRCYMWAIALEVTYEEVLLLYSSKDLAWLTLF